MAISLRLGMLDWFDDEPPMMNRRQNWCNFCGRWATWDNNITCFGMSLAFQRFDDNTGRDYVHYRQAVCKPLCRRCTIPLWVVGRTPTQTAPGVYEVRSSGCRSRVCPSELRDDQWWCGLCSDSLENHHRPGEVGHATVAEARYARSLSYPFEGSVVLITTFTKLCRSCTSALRPRLCLCEREDA